MCIHFTILSCKVKIGKKKFHFRINLCLRYTKRIRAIYQKYIYIYTEIFQAWVDK